MGTLQVHADHAAELVEVSRFPTYGDAEQHALVLVAVGIGCRLVPGKGDVGLCVAAHDVERAVQELDAYARENAPARQPPRDARSLLHGRNAGLVYGAVLLFFSGAERRHAWSLDWLAAGAAQAGLIRDGAWWRALTALTLHADLGHLAGNLLAGIVFGMFAAQLLGPGLAWLAILLAGGLGNGLNAFLQPPDHTAVGASTALFGAVGILSGFVGQRRVVPWRGGIRRMAPLVAGVLLLVHLGFGGERTDVGAHVAGFAVGCGLGFVLARFAAWVPQGPRAQRLCGLVACGLLALAWLLALREPA